MEKSRSSKIIAIVALVVAVAGLSVGFAAFSNTLMISSRANVTPNSDTFKVVFSSDDASLETNKITGKTTATTGVTVGEATIVNSGATPTISGLTAGFTVPGESVTYEFYVHNAGEYEAFLKSINYANVTGQNNPKVCTAVDTANTTASLVSKACEDITLTVKVGNVTANGTETGLSQSLEKKGFTPVTVTIAYADNGNRADGDFNVSFGDISLTYSTAG